MIYSRSQFGNDRNSTREDEKQQPHATEDLSELLYVAAMEHWNLRPVQKQTETK